MRNGVALKAQRDGLQMLQPAETLRERPAPLGTDRVPSAVTTITTVATEGKKREHKSN